MLNKDELKRLLSEYQKSIIQSEAEVRSKFIVPLLNFLQYPTELRAEEFPVYGFEGAHGFQPKMQTSLCSLIKNLRCTVNLHSQR